MKLIIIITGLTCILFLSNCTNNNNSQPVTGNDKFYERFDSLKWLFYAYTFQSKVIFKKEAKEYDPVSCDVMVDTLIQNGNSLIFLLSFFKDGVKSNHIQEGMNLQGFAYSLGAAKPLAPMLVFDNFDNIEHVRRDNYQTDSLFRAFLKEKGKSQVSGWLLKEANKRKVWEE